MNFVDFVIVSTIFVLVGLCIKSLVINRKNGCSGGCTSCNTTVCKNGKQGLLDYYYSK